MKGVEPIPVIRSAYLNLLIDVLKETGRNYKTALQQFDLPTRLTNKRGAHILLKAALSFLRWAAAAPAMKTSDGAPDHVYGSPTSMSNCVARHCVPQCLNQHCGLSTDTYFNLVCGRTGSCLSIRRLSTSSLPVSSLLLRAKPQWYCVAHTCAGNKTPHRHRKSAGHRKLNAIPSPSESGHAATSSIIFPHRCGNSCARLRACVPTTPGVVPVPC